MNKRSTIITITAVLVVLWAVLGVINYNQVKNLELPSLSWPGAVDDTGMITYFGAGYSFIIEGDTDESGNVTWAATEMMAVVIKSAPKQYREFVKIMVHNGLDSPMCHHGVLWAVGYLGADYYNEIESFLPKLVKFLDSNDDELRGLAIWALKALQYEPAFDKINSMAEDTARTWIYENGKLQQKTIGQIINNKG